MGIYAHLILTDVSDTDLIVPTLVSDPAVFPFWAADFLIVAIVAAAMSSMDSVLLVRINPYKNLIAPFRATSSAATKSNGPLCGAGFAMTAAAMALNPPGIS